ncbi:MAG TPA: PIG-L family deacetylase, partial [Mycobacteriales bacterium]|jgi:LmbE family N-acetylglucosaminyl deacetylase|nr:PIG-L family deacetylase [Mycobacteriales bacterium]
VWATDGEASHPATTALTRLELAALRRAESERALEALGVTPSATHHLGLPDSGLSDHVEELRGALEGILRTDDLVIAPWVADGHPDHEIAGLVSRDSGCECWQYPVWMWHWASPTDLRVPWDRIRTHEVPDRGAKLAAIAEFVTQIHPIGPHAEDAAVLPPQVLARFVRPTEWIFS